MTTPDPFACAVFLIVAFVVAGLAHSAWLRTAASRRLMFPIDAGLRLRGRRLLGDNKTVRGFLVLVPATAASFPLLFAASTSVSPGLASALWPLDTRGYALLGMWAGLGFMLGELPNSFVKRQLDVSPGQSPGHRAGAGISFVIDHIDSILGMLAAISLATPTPWLTWAYVLAIGSAIHLMFSALLYRLGVKARVA